DTMKASVASAALEVGASWINDVSALRFDSAMVDVVAKSGAALCLMHMQGTPETMQKNPVYEDVVDEALTFLEQALSSAESAGISRERVWVDPGIGFGKTTAHNLFLLRRLGDFRLLGAPVLLGTSRKGFLGALIGGKPPSERLPATLASLVPAVIA